MAKRMDRKSRNSIAALALSITLGLISIAAQPGGVPPGHGGNQPNRSQPPAPSGRPSESPQNNNPGQPEEQPSALIGTERTPAIVRITKTQEEAAQEQADREREATTQRWTIGLAIATAIFTGLLVAVGLMQRKTYEAQLTTTRAIERAQIYVAGVTEYTNFAPGQEPRLMVTVINAGNSAGRIFESGIATIPVLAVQGDLPRPMPDPGMHPSNLMLVKGQRMDWGNKLGPVPREDYDRVFTHNFKLVIFGRIRYRDTFNDVHRTDFSFVYDPKQWPAGHIEFVIDPNGYSEAD